MFFVLSKALLFLLSPAFWIILLLLLSFYTKHVRRKKVLRVTSLVLFIIFTNPFIFNLACRSWQPSPVTLPPGAHYTAAIILGGLMMFDKDNIGYHGDDADRIIEAVKLYQAGSVKNIAVTGGSPSLYKKQPPEADYIVRELLALGVPAEHIISENSAKNTFENAVYIKQRLDSLHLAAPYVLVTSAIHIPRAKAVFEKAGVQVIPYPAAYKQVNNKKYFPDMIIPSVDVLPGWHQLLKEIVGLAVYRITGKA